eukprot:s2122_g15.t1
MIAIQDTRSCSIGKVLSSLLNRKQQPLHLCRDAPCSYAAEEGLVHAVAAAWWDASTFDAAYMKPWGRMVIKEYLNPAEEEPHIATPRGPRRSALKRPAGKSVRPRAGPSGDGHGTGDARKDGSREKLKRLRGDGGASKKPDGGPIFIPSSEGSAGNGESDSAEDEEESAHSEGPNRPRTSLNVTDLVKREESGEEKTKKARVRKKKKEKGKTTKDPGLQLLAQAAQVREARKERSSEKRSSSKSRSGPARVKELVRALAKGVSGKKARSSKRGTKKNKEEGEPSSSGGSSDGSEEGEDGSETSSSEMLAPLQKKSSKKPGTVLKMLIQHAKQVLDQTAVVETGATIDVTAGVKMTSYFNLMIRPYHPANALMKELHHLSVCLDELRSGELGKLGDSLASRFLALHTAANEGSWRAAQFLEIHPLEPTSGAPASLLLEARKHGKLVTKAQGLEDWRRPQQDGASWGSNAKGGGNSKGKSKGKGKDWSRQGKGDPSGQGKGAWGKNANVSYWASQKEGAEIKDAKTGDKDAKK